MPTTNFVELMDNLKLGIESAVFIDDNPAERDRVKAALPEVLVPDWPQDKTQYKKALLSLTCFDSAHFTDEDRKRTQMYRSEESRSQLKRTLASADDWLKSLETTLTIDVYQKENLPRIVQLINKTNQMNLTTRRSTEKELVDWLKAEQHQLWSFRVTDKFGDSGLTGVASLSFGHDGECEVVDFILSCRVIGREIEVAMTRHLIEAARIGGQKVLTMHYKPTPKNKPCKDFLEKSGLDARGAGLFAWDLKKAYREPKFLRLRDAGDARC